MSLRVPFRQRTLLPVTLDTPIEGLSVPREWVGTRRSNDAIPSALEALLVAQRSDRLKQKADARQRADIDAALTRLAGMGERDFDKRNLDKREMGTLFKAMAIAHLALPPPPGFDRTPAPGDAA